MPSRRKARRIAIDIIYQADVTNSKAARVMEDWAAVQEVPGFSAELVTGVSEHRDEIDLELEGHSEDWHVSRMPAVDRAILRVAVYELLHSPDVPPAVAISQAVEAANELSTEDSGRFVNGLLGKIARELAGGA